MLERIYFRLLRLYPTAFQKAFGEEALQLVRDRLRDERGLIARLRLCRDLAADLAISVPREFRYAQPSLAGAQTPRLQAGPVFAVLEGKPPTPTSMALAGIVSAAFFAGVAFLIGHGGGHLVLRSLSMHPERQLSGPGFAPERAPEQPGAGGDPAALESGAVKADSSSNSPATDASAAEQPWQRAATTATPAAKGVPALVEMDAAYTRWVVASIAADLHQHYFDPAIAGQLAGNMQSRAAAGVYDAVPDDRTLAQLLTRQMRASTGDLHLEVVYDAGILPHASAGPTTEDLARYRNAMMQSHCTIESVQMLPHEIGYLKLNSFPDPAVCREQLISAMGRLNQAQAVIYDLRDNSGGFPEGVRLMAGYLFNRPQFLYSPRGASDAQSWTTPMPGNLLADKPVYILASHTTLSGAEQFVYNLKMLKRATIVGETTGGATHAGVFHRIDDHFGVAIPQARAVNPYGKSDWEGVGVAPDIQVSPADALLVAERLAAEKLKSR